MWARCGVETKTPWPSSHPRGLLSSLMGWGEHRRGIWQVPLPSRRLLEGLHAGEEMEEALTRANQKILGTAETQPALAGMGTTLTALRVSLED